MLSRATFFLLCLLSFGLSAQILTPVSWETNMEALDEEGTYALRIIAQMDEGWAVYSQFTPDGGPIPTLITWSEGPHFELLGDADEQGHRKAGMDDMFGVEVIKFLSDEDLVFTQRVKVKDFSTPIEVTLEYMCCDDEQCLPPTEEFFSFSPEPVGPGQGSTQPEGAPAADAGKSLPEQAVAANAGAVSNTGSQVDADADPNTAATPSTENLTVSETTEPVAFADGLELTVSEPPPTEYDPVTWVLSVNQQTADEYQVIMHGVIEDDWYTYSSNNDPDVGFIPNQLTIEGEGLELLGEMLEESPKAKEGFEDVWGVDVNKVYESVTYTQRIKVAPATTAFTGLITYQTCKEVCLPPEDIPFSVDLAQQKITLGEQIGGVPTSPAVVAGDVPEIDPTPQGNCSIGEADVQNKSLLGIFGLGFLGGLFALIMPCIFPMIPLTVNFFNKSGGSRSKGVQRAALYGFFIFAIYIVLSIPFHLVEGVSANVLNDIASNVWLNLFFFAVFIFFAGSFFGFYELTLPSSWTNRSSRAEGSGGFVGIFFMALTLALVSFSCTGPILGSLLVGAVSDGAWPLTAGMAGFGLALALPFTLFAAFPQLLKSMPSSGGWLNSVKVVLGFVEIGLALKFLSNADLVGHWDWLKIEYFYIVWILCCVGTAAYLFGFIQFPHDSKNRKIGITGMAIAVLFLGFGAYLVSGFQKDPEVGSYQPLGLISGFPPPVCYSAWNPCEGVQGIPVYKDLEEGLAAARAAGKPAMLDFTGFSCVNCRRMEENVWVNDKIRNMLIDDYVIISLYVDDRMMLPESDHEIVPRLDRPDVNKKIDQVGEKWHYLQQSVFERSSQPYYVLISPDGQTLNPPVAYTPDVDEYAAFLKCGLSTYQSLSGGSVEPGPLGSIK